jgi:hypothetical protein
MKRVWHRRVLTAAMVVGVVAALFFWVLPPPHPASRLPDGTVLTLLDVTHGATNIFYSASALCRLIYRFAPAIAKARGIHFGPINIAPVSPIVDLWRREDGTVAYPNRAVMWLGHSVPSNGPPLPLPKEKWFSDTRVTLSSENGEEWDQSTGMRETGPSSIRGLNWITTWDFASFPRRGKKLRFRLYARNKSNGWDTLADFKFSNPCPGPYPVWKPSPLPATQKNGDLEVSLVGLVSGMEPCPYVFGDRQFTRATFEVKENGRATEAWLPDQVETTDATGNEPQIPMVRHYATNRLVSYEMQRVSLSPSEVWRLRTRFCKEGNKAGEQIWTSPRLFLQGKVLANVNIATNIQSFKITLVCENSPFTNTIRLKLHPLPAETRLCFPEIVDNRGRAVTYKSGGIGDSGFDAQWKVPAEAEWIQLNLRLAQTRTFEFVARPISIHSGSH